jgi:ABC-type polar amino acid transport system ATPase subunit
MIEVKNLKKVYNNNAVLKDVNAVIEKVKLFPLSAPLEQEKAPFCAV